MFPKVFSVLLSLAFTFKSGAAQTSCAGRCGTEYYRGYQCQCDYSCLQYEECCPDYENQCTTQDSCTGRCGESFRRGRRCSCDFDCGNFNQCCPDFSTACEAEEPTSEEELQDSELENGNNEEDTEVTADSSTTPTPINSPSDGGKSCDDKGGEVSKTSLVPDSITEDGLSPTAPLDQASTDPTGDSTGADSAAMQGTGSVTNDVATSIPTQTSVDQSAVSDTVSGTGTPYKISTFPQSTISQDATTDQPTPNSASPEESAMPTKSPDPTSSPNPEDATTGDTSDTPDDSPVTTVPDSSAVTSPATADGSAPNPDDVTTQDTGGTSDNSQVTTVSDSSGFTSPATPGETTVSSQNPDDVTTQDTTGTPDNSHVTTVLDSSAVTSPATADGSTPNSQNPDDVTTQDSSGTPDNSEVTTVSDSSGFTSAVTPGEMTVSSQNPEDTTTQESSSTPEASEVTTVSDSSAFTSQVTAEGPTPTPEDSSGNSPTLDVGATPELTTADPNQATSDPTLFSAFTSSNPQDTAATTVSGSSTLASPGTAEETDLNSVTGTDTAEDVSAASPSLVTTPEDSSGTQETSTADPLKVSSDPNKLSAFTSAPQGSTTPEPGSNMFTSPANPRETTPNMDAGSDTGPNEDAKATSQSLVATVQDSSTRSPELDAVATTADLLKATLSPAKDPGFPSNPQNRPDPFEERPRPGFETKPQIYNTGNVGNEIDDINNDPNLCSGKPITGATTLRNGTVVIFRGHFFWFLDRNRVPNPAQSITRVWGVPSPIDTVFTRCNCDGKTYIIKGNQYWRYDNDALESGYPKVVKRGFGGLQGHITAALSVPQYGNRGESVYFFKRGGLVQKYSYQYGTGTSCRRTLNRPVSVVRVRRTPQTVKYRYFILRLGTILGPTINIRTSWRGFPTRITAAMSVPSPDEPEGYKYILFSKSTPYNVRMDTGRPVIFKSKASASTQSKQFIKCPKKP